MLIKIVSVSDCLIDKMVVVKIMQSMKYEEEKATFMSDFSMFLPSSRTVLLKELLDVPTLLAFCLEDQF